MKTKALNLKYPTAKLIDMYFWQAGAKEAAKIKKAKAEEKRLKELAKQNKSTA